MKRSLWIITLVVLGMVVASPPLLRAHNDHDCDIAGAWVGNTPPIPGFYKRTLIVTVTVIPTDPSGKRFAGVAQPANPPFKSETEFNPDGIYTFVRSGPRTYEFTLMAYAAKPDWPERSQITSLLTFSGTAECNGTNTLTLNGMVSLYDKSMDSNDDGLPDPGAQPYFRAPWVFNFNRLPLMTP